MRTSVKKNAVENRFEFSLPVNQVQQLQARLAAPLDTDLDAWWQRVGLSMGFIADSVASVRWKRPDGRVVPGPLPLGQACEVSFTAIAVPVGLPDDLGEGFREWLTAAHPRLVWQTNDGVMRGTLFHPAAFEAAFDAGHDYANEQNKAAVEGHFGDDPLAWLAELAKASPPLCEIATKSINLIDEQCDQIARLASERPQAALPVDAFVTMEVKAAPDADPVFAVKTQDPRFDPAKPATINGYAFVPIADLAAACGCGAKA